MTGYVLFALFVIALLLLAAVLVRRGHRHAKERTERDLERSIRRARGEFP